MNASEQTFVTLHDCIINGQYQRGDYLNPKDLCNELKVSLVPVREALIRLSERHLLDWDRNRGFKVSNLEIRDIISIFEQLRSLYCIGISHLSRTSSKKDMRAISKKVVTEPRALEKNFQSFCQEILSPRENLTASNLRNQLWYVRSILQHDEDVMARIASDLLDICAAIEENKFENASKIWTRSFGVTNQDAIKMILINRKNF